MNKPIISVFTPTNNTSWIKETWGSLLDQTVDFEWLIGINGKADIKNIPSDPRIKIINTGEWKGVGHAKKTLCDLACGEILVELDHDDILSEGALNKIQDAFLDPEVGFAFSDFAEWNDADGTPYVYGSSYGWESYPCKIRGRNLIAMRAMPANAERLSLIMWAPNHVRCWRKSLYEKIGGHDISLNVADDFDLVLRSYLDTKFFHIPEPLYGYRRRSDGNNTYIINNAEIQRLCGAGENRELPSQGQPLPLRDKYLHKVIERECSLKNLPMIDIGGGIFGAPGWTTLDVSGEPSIKWDVFANKKLPFEDNSVGAFRAFDFLEHGEDMDSFWLMDEIWRCLVPNGYFISYTPHALGIGASCDPSHRSRWDERRFLYWASDALRPFLISAYPKAQAKFKPLRLYKENRIMGPSPWKFDVPYVVADLIAVK